MEFRVSHCFRCCISVAGPHDGIFLSRGRSPSFRNYFAFDNVDADIFRLIARPWMKCLRGGRSKSRLQDYAGLEIRLKKSFKSLNSKDNQSRPCTAHLKSDAASIVKITEQLAQWGRASVHFGPLSEVIETDLLWPGAMRGERNTKPISKQLLATGEKIFFSFHESI